MPIASFTVDHAARVTAWSAEAADRFGYPAGEVVGRHLGFLLPHTAPDPTADAASIADAVGVRRVVPALFRDGGVREVELACTPLTEPDGGHGLLCRVTDTADAVADDVQAAFTDALMRASPFGLGVLDTDLRYVLVNEALAEFNGIPVREHLGRRVAEVVRAADGGEYEEHLRKVLQTGVPLHNVLIASRSRGRRDRDRVWAVTFFRLTAADGRVLGLGGLIVDVTQKESALLDASAFRQRLELVNQAGSRVGTTLEMTETARELVDFAVPEFADAATVELREDFPGGGGFPSPGVPVATIRLAGRSDLRTPEGRALFADVGAERVHPAGTGAQAVLCGGGSWLAVADGPTPPPDPGGPWRPSPDGAGSAWHEGGGGPTAGERGGPPAVGEHGGPPTVRGAEGAADAAIGPGDTAAAVTRAGTAAAYREAETRPFRAAGVGSLVTVPLVARDRCLGIAQFGRSGDREPLDEDDLKVAEELAARAALSLDNARMYDEERRVAVALQRTMLPDDDDLNGPPGLEVADHYWSTSRSAEVGGDWFDVIPLSGHRVALVIGDMMGHDIQAAAGMGQLRTAMHTLARLDLEPADLLTRLDAIVESSPAMQIATCTYAVHDTVTRECVVANAGHPPPVLRLSDGSTRIVPVVPGMPLGIGLGRPGFAVVKVDLPPDATLVLYTDGLIERRGQDIGVGIEALRAALAEPMPPDRSLQRACDDLVARLADRTGDDDLAVLMARAPAMPDQRAVRWRVPPVPASVPRVRALVRRTLHSWGLPDLVDPTELLLSELVTNAVRHAREDVGIQLAKGETLVAEVTDDDERLPHRMRGGTTDPRGRGLVVVDELAGEWGARSVADGKVVWFEVPLSRK
jgi:serine phosphatase RsbU (regulator of sigma subunit)/PAS domain-containing protein/anti-sigma regulatory factor (Ser/Thr protein kinase)